MHKWICESFWMESWLAVHLLIKRSRSNRAWPSLALSSPESRSTRSVGRVHLASIISSMIKFVSLFEIDDNVVVIMSHSGRKHPCQNFKIVTNVKQIYRLPSRFLRPASLRPPLPSSSNLRRRRSSRSRSSMLETEGETWLYPLRFQIHAGSEPPSPRRMAPSTGRRPPLGLDQRH